MTGDPSRYVFKTEPYEHQRRGFLLSADAEHFAYTMEQRTGKTKVILDRAGYAYEAGRIDALLIIAPNGVHRNWTNEEAPIHLPDRLNWRPFYWGELNPGTKKFRDRAEELLAHRGLLLVTVNVEAIATEPFKAFARPILAKRRVFTAIDESSIIKTPGIPRTRTALAIGQRSVLRAIADGTPDAENPLELFSQYQFLSPAIFGFSSFYAFRARYAEMETRQAYDPKTKGTREYKTVKTYQNLDELNAKRAPVTFRVLRSDVFDMPEKVYQKRWYQPSPLQVRVYEELRETFRSEVRCGLEVTSTNVLARYVRYQQVLSNFVPGTAFVLCPACAGAGCAACDDGGVIASTEPPRALDPGNHPRLDALEEEYRANPTTATITWACYDREIDDIVNLLRDLGRKPVRYDGKVSDDEKERAKRDFQAGVAGDFVGKATSGGRGLTLSRAGLLIYYNNFFALRPRLQSEDRAEGAKKTTSTGVVDVMATPWSDAPTIDEIKVAALRGKRSLSALVNGDPGRTWL